MIMKSTFHDSRCQIDQEDVLFLNFLLSSSLERSCYLCKYSIISHLLTVFFCHRQSSHMSGEVHISVKLERAVGEQLSTSRCCQVGVKGWHGQKILDVSNSASVLHSFHTYIKASGTGQTPTLVTRSCTLD